MRSQLWSGLSGSICAVVILLYFIFDISEVGFRSASISASETAGCDMQAQKHSPQTS